MPVGPLGQFVVAQQHVDLSRVLALEGREQVEELVRLVAAARVGVLAVDDLLQDQVPARVLAEVGRLVDGLEVAQVAVQVAGDEHLVGVLKLDESAPCGRASAGRRRRPCKACGAGDRGRAWATGKRKPGEGVWKCR